MESLRDTSGSFGWGGGDERGKEDGGDYTEIWAGDWRGSERSGELKERHRHD